MIGKEPSVNTQLDMWRYAIWEEAKGKLQAMTCLIYNDQTLFDELRKAIDDFVAEVEANYL